MSGVEWVRKRNEIETHSTVTYLVEHKSSMDRIYCAEQIVVPPELPSILKAYTKEVIRRVLFYPRSPLFAHWYFMCELVLYLCLV